MAASTIDISDNSRELLNTLVSKTGKSAAEVLQQALITYRRQVFMAEMNRGYAELRADAQAWTEHVLERKEFDATISDGLDSKEHWTSDGKCITDQ